MTAGHKHRVVTVWPWVREVLRTPVFHTYNEERAARSPYPWGPCAVGDRCWYLSPLSLLHRWFGLTLLVPGCGDPTCKEKHP